MQLSPLTLEHLDEIVFLEQAFPPGMQQGREKLRQRLTDLAASRCSFSFVGRDDQGVFGYLMAHGGHTHLDLADPYPVVYVSEIQCEPGVPGGLYGLLRALTRSIAGSQYHGCPIEAHCRPDLARLLLGHPKPLRRLGYVAHSSYEYTEERTGEPMTWLQLRTV